MISLGLADAFSIASKSILRPIAELATILLTLKSVNFLSLTKLETILFLPVESLAILSVEASKILFAKASAARRLSATDFAPIINF